jgi:tryptophan synthase alpha chain
MNPIDSLFDRLRQSNRRAFIPFVTAGDPDLETTGLLLRELAARGASLIELGIPYSDPIADGPVIQASYTRALDNGIKLADILASVGRWTREPGTKLGSEVPLVSMISYSIVYRHGPARYVAEAKEAGFSGAVIPDLPAEEADELARLAAEHEFALIELVTPTTSPERAARIVAASTGFIYYVSVAGITGERNQLPPELAGQLERLRRQTRLPICVGFGISRPEQVRMLAPVADGVIVGSALVRRLAEAEGKSREDLIRDAGQFVAEMAAALG